MKKDHRDRALALASEIEAIIETVDLLASDTNNVSIEVVVQELEAAVDTLRTEAGE